MLTNFTLYEVLNGGCCDDSHKTTILYSVTVRSMVVHRTTKRIYSDIYKQQYIKK